jgi:hypothetical protein
VSSAQQAARAFKTAWFAKAARKARIKDDELREAIQEVMKGQADDFGGGVFKKRLTLAKSYATLSGKQIEQLLADNELVEIRHGDENEVQGQYIRGDSDVCGDASPGRRTRQGDDARFDSRQTAERHGAQTAHGRPEARPTGFSLKPATYRGAAPGIKSFCFFFFRKRRYFLVLF